MSKIPVKVVHEYDYISIQQIYVGKKDLKLLFTDNLRQFNLKLFIGMIVFIYSIFKALYTKQVILRKLKL